MRTRKNKKIKKERKKEKWNRPKNYPRVMN
jgi:hypothetical protein